MIDLTKIGPDLPKRRLKISKFRAGGLKGRLGSSPQAKIMIDLTKRGPDLPKRRLPES